MIFGFIEDSVKNVMDVFCDTMDGEDISREKLAKLVADGIEIVLIAEAVGVSVEYLEELLADGES